MNSSLNTYTTAALGFERNSYTLSSAGSRPAFIREVDLTCFALNAMRLEQFVERVLVIGTATSSESGDTSLGWHCDLEFGQPSFTQMDALAILSYTVKLRAECLGVRADLSRSVLASILLRVVNCANRSVFTAIRHLIAGSNPPKERLPDAASIIMPVRAITPPRGVPLAAPPSAMPLPICPTVFFTELSLSFTELSLFSAAYAGIHTEITINHTKPIANFLKK